MSRRVSSLVSSGHVRREKRRILSINGTLEGHVSGTGGRTGVRRGPDCAVCGMDSGARVMQYIP